jgi:hypothetical protein
VPAAPWASSFVGPAPETIEIGLVAYPTFFGSITLAGSSIRPLPELEIDPLDVVPTAAVLLGIPLARDLPGHVLLEAIGAERFEPDLTCASYKSFVDRSLAAVRASSDAR